MTLPQALDDLTPAFLTEALADVLGGGRVTDVTCDDIGTGVGVFGVIGRLHLTVADAAGDVPDDRDRQVPHRRRSEPPGRAGARVVRTRAPLLRHGRRQRPVPGPTVLLLVRRRCDRRVPHLDGGLRLPRRG